MAALAPAYGVVFGAALILKLGEPWWAAIAVPFVLVSAIPLLTRGSRAFNGACYTAIALLACAGCFGGVLFLPAALPLLFATPPALGAPLPQACVAAVLAVTGVTVLNLF
ncbi:hypothetical protein [Actinoplanes utahensis]|uniref:Uncharacterized protein n=1 Tax=Actinoplanes utahensis TaxID=1869 RepID=A0A0A6X665_ACTUT|nr:hypothetical protein [Actinoplanes utahensis]KHD75607.1 hypothetical protein MB27_21525 [Actinoplanes utahensis]GIF27126.1 hypothetical protein Aut01nite_01120 [Actinoplanes utahensis]